MHFIVDKFVFIYLIFFLTNTYTWLLHRFDNKIFYRLIPEYLYELSLISLISSELSNIASLINSLGQLLVDNQNNKTFLHVYENIANERVRMIVVIFLYCKTHFRMQREKAEKFINFMWTLCNINPIKIPYIITNKLNWHEHCI